MNFQLTSSIDWNEFSDNTLVWNYHKSWHSRLGAQIVSQFNSSLIWRKSEDISAFEGGCYDFTNFEKRTNMHPW